MHLKAFVTAAAAILCLGRGAAAAPLEAYGRLPAIETAVISPDGGALALVVTNGERRKIAIRDLASGVTQVLDSGDAKVRDLEWAGSGHLLILTSLAGTENNLSIRRGEYGRAYDYDLSTRKMRPLMGDTDLVVNALFDRPQGRTVDGKELAFVGGLTQAANGTRVALYHVVLDAGFTRLDNEGFPDTYAWLVGPDGQPLAEAEYTTLTGRWALKVLRKGSWVTAKVLDDPEEIPVLAGLGRDGRSALVKSLDDGVWTYREVSTETAAWGPAVADGPGVQAILEPGSARLIGFSNLAGGVRKAELFDARDQAIWKAVAAAYPGDRVELVSWSADRRRLVARVDSPATGPAYALVDLAAKASTWIGDAYPELKAADIAPARAIAFAARDGLALTGLVTLPAGRAAEKLPLVVLPHPGPAAHDEPGFDWWAQALASRGYAVLQVNYRGSDGLGRDLLKAGYGEWGRKMQSDLADGVAELARQGLVDPGRVCIVGQDYGGYAALAGMTLEPGRYRCATSLGGVADPGRLIAWLRKERGGSSLRRWTRYLGAEDKDAPALKAISPAAHAAAASGPILLIHGEDDVVVPHAQSELMAEALRAAGKPVELVTLPDEDHWLTNGATRRQALAAVSAFLEKNNPPQ